MGAADDERVKQLILSDEFELKYRDEVDRESAYEIIMAARQELTAQQQREAEEAAAEKQRLKEEAAAEKQRQKEEAAAERQRQREEAAAEKQRLKEEAAAQKAAEKQAAARYKTAERAVSNAASSVARSHEHQSGQFYRGRPQGQRGHHGQARGYQRPQLRHALGHQFHRARAVWQQEVSALRREGSARLKMPSLRAFFVTFFMHFTAARGFQPLFFML